MIFFMKFGVNNKMNLLKHLIIIIIMMLQIFYGTKLYYLDVTTIALQKCVQNNVLTIPTSEKSRSDIFGDPLVGILKNIYIKMDFEDNKIDKIYQHFETLIIDLSFLNISDYIDSYKKSGLEVNTESPVSKLSRLHNKLLLDYGNFTQEYPEQLLSMGFIKGNEKVLEIGGNIGRNSLVIASLLIDDKNLVTLETDKNIVEQLSHNRNINNFTFNIEASALSYKKLIQKDWNTIPSDIVIDGYTIVDTITFEDLETKYNITFDTLIIDCEGALYYILKDNEDILNNINLMIMENDYTDIQHKLYVDSIFVKKGFKRVLKMAGGWGPCYEFFYEVWSK